MAETLATPVAAASGTGDALRFTGAEWRRLIGFYGCIGGLHAVGWGVFLFYSYRYPSMVGLGLAAYLFGLRHAFDADHIAAVDDTVRYLLQRGQQPLGVGFFFSLGHASVVFALAVAVTVVGARLRMALPGLQQYGGLIGAGVSGAFLWLVGLLNLVLLLDMLKLWRRARSGAHNHTHMEQLLRRRGLVNRLFGGRLRRLVSHSWQMYPVGVLFGLGFDTASEIGLLAMTAGAATGEVPVAAALSLPILFAAGMSAMDTTDGVLMTRAYNWAFANPLRRIFYNLATTSLSILLALVIGSVELLQVLSRVTGWRGQGIDALARLDLGTLGYLVVGLLLLAWLVSVTVWKCGRFQRRPPPVVYGHVHRHAGMSPHAHRVVGAFDRVTPRRPR